MLLVELLVPWALLLLATTKSEPNASFVLLLAVTQLRVPCALLLATRKSAEKSEDPKEFRRCLFSAELRRLPALVPRRIAGGDTWKSSKGGGKSAAAAATLFGRVVARLSWALSAGLFGGVRVPDSAAFFRANRLAAAPDEEAEAVELDRLMMGFLAKSSKGGGASKSVVNVQLGDAIP